MWELEIRTQDATTPAILELRSEAELPAELGIRLLDREQQVSVDLLRPGGPLEDYELLSHGPEHPYRLSLRVGTVAFLEEGDSAGVELPADVVLEHGPNPIRGAARIRFGLPRAGSVVLGIYDVRGKRVAMLKQGEVVTAGYHTSIWKGTDAQGRPLANGMYFCRIEAGTVALTRKLVLMR